MARTKADLIADCKERGVELTGDETISDLKELLETAGESPATADVDEGAAADPSAEESSALTLDDAAYGEHIVVDGNVVPAPVGWTGEKPRRLTHNGRNVEHTHDLDNGVWCYRSM